MPVGSSSIQILWGFPVLKVCVISEDSEGVLSPSQVVPPMGKHFHHGKQLLFVNVIITLHGGKGGRIVCNGVEFGLPFLVRGCVSFASLLGEYCSDPVCR